MSHRKSQCRSCGASIYWAYTAAERKKMPVDADPVEGGNVLLTSKLDPDFGDRYLEAEVVTNDAEVPEDRNRYVSHFVTCPNAGTHRKGDK